MKKLYTLMFLCFIAIQLLAQNRVIQGRVTDDASKPISGASVQIKGTQTGTTTGSDGEFSLSVPESARTLVISSVGMTAQEIRITSSNNYAVTLSSEARNLSEVVVVGYGTQRRRELTGSISRLRDTTLSEIPLQGPDQALRGKVPGVNVTQSSGTPGASINVTIRGNGTINTSNQPLYVIDGVIINTGGYSQIDVGGQVTNILADINPNDIESYEVLKDAAAAAIYGARGANGVILITTKKGTNQKTRINLDMSAGQQQAWRKIPTLSGPDYVRLIQEEVKNYGIQMGFGSNIVPSDFGFVGLDADPSTYPTTNWQDLIFRKAPIQNYQVSVSGGSDRTRFYLSGAYANQKGIIIGSDFKRYSTRLNLDHSISNKFRISTGITMARSTSNRINNDNNIYGALSTAVLSSTYYSPYDSATGQYAHDPNLGILENPIAAGTIRFNQVTDDRVIANIAAEYQFFPFLTLRVQGSADYLAMNEAQFLPSTTNEGASGPNGIGREGYTKVLNLLNENILTYRQSFGQHTITATGVASYQKSTFESMFGEGKNFPGDNIRRLSAASTKSILTSDGTEEGLIGYLLRVNYDFGGKYLLSGSVRRDGSSILGSEKRYGTFPAVSAGWRISEEDFMKGSKIFSDLKIRGSYGKLGNVNGLGRYASRALVGVGSNYVVNASDAPGLAPIQIGNDSLKWEESKQADLGLDVGLWKNRIQLTVDLYKKNTNDLLLARPLVGSSGFTSVNQNIGKIENKGIEFGLNTINIQGKEFTWGTNFNISFNKNRVKEISGSPFPSGFASWVAPGYAIGSFYGYKVVGIFQTAEEIQKAPKQSQYTAPGDIQFADLNGDGVIDSKDQTVLGDANPKYWGGMTNNFSYKGFELSIFLQFQYGNKILNVNRQFAEGMNSLFGQYATVNNRWTPTNTNTDIPRAIISDLNDNTRNSDRFIEDGSYLRAKNIILGYNIPRTVLNKIKLSSLKVYIQAQNVKTWTKYSGFDPEVSSFSITNTAPGTDFLTYPQAKSYTIGLNIGF